ncbi:hypothetical protein Tco_0633447 [Tanacetum coccineum]
MSPTHGPSKREDPSVKIVHGSGTSSSAGISVGGASSSGLSVIKYAKIWLRIDVLGLGTLSVLLLDLVSLTLGAPRCAASFPEMPFLLSRSIRACQLSIEALHFFQYPWGPATLYDRDVIFLASLDSLPMYYDGHRNIPDCENMGTIKLRWDRRVLGMLEGLPILVYLEDLAIYLYVELYTTFSALAGKLRWRERSWVFELNKSDLCPTFIEGLSAKGLGPSCGGFPYWSEKHVHNLLPKVITRIEGWHERFFYVQDSIIPAKYSQLLSEQNKLDSKSFKDKLPPNIKENPMFQRLGRYPTSVHVFPDPILFLAGLKPSWEYGQQRPAIMAGGKEIAFRNFIYTEDDEELSFLPKEPSPGFARFTNCSVNKKPLKADIAWNPTCKFMGT